jgi:hypothetical protein
MEWWRRTDAGTSPFEKRSVEVVEMLGPQPIQPDGSERGPNRLLNGTAMLADGVLRAVRFYALDPFIEKFGDAPGVRSWSLLG